MANPNADPTMARRAKRRKKKAGSLEDARRLLWRALERAEELLEAEDPETGVQDNQTALRAIHAISQGASAYARIVEVGELEARIAALEVVTGGDGPQLSKGAA